MFTYPLILLALVAVAIPIAVHLFNFRRYRKVYFSNVDYLQELQQQTRKQSELMRWLVLAARILAIICLVIAFAQPVIPGTGKHLKPGGCAVSIYLDNSFSMNNTNSDGTLLEMGRNKVKEIVAAYDMDDQFQLITNETDGSQFRWLSKDELFEELEKVDISPRTLTISSMGEKMYDFLNRSHAANRHCYIISDFQASSTDLEDWKSDTNIQSTFVVLEGSTLDNLYIDSISLNAPTYYQGNTLEAAVCLRNNGSNPMEQVQIKLIANDKQRAIATVDVPAKGKADATLKMQVDLTGTLDCRVEITDYPITFDDKFFFSVNVNSRINVAVIGEKNEYLDRLFDDDSTISYTRMAERDINYESLNQKNFIILNEVSTISSGLAQTLLSWVNEGGSLFVVPGTAIDPSYASAMAAWKTPILGEWQKTKMSVTNIDLEDGLFRGVFNGKTEEMEMPTLQGYHLMNAGPNSSRSSIMQLANGGDYLTATPSGNGKIYVTAAPLRIETTDWVRQALFVPVVYNMALYSRQMGSLYHIIGSEGAIQLANSYELPHLIGNGVDILPETRQNSGRCYIVTHNQVAQAGNYTISENKVQEGISFNYSRLESDMASYSEAEIASMIDNQRLTECSVVPNAKKSMEAYIRQQRNDKPLWRWFVVGALACLLAETLLLRRIRKTKTDAKS